MAKTRPYSVSFKGAKRMVIATSQATARRHIIADEMRKIDQEITIETAGAMAVANFVGGGGKIETVGVFIDPPEEDGEQEGRIPRFLVSGGHRPDDSDAGEPPAGGSGADETAVKQ